MSEFPQCPYCGAILWESQLNHKEEGIRLQCDSCARTYVYIPGYGSFALSDSEVEHFESPVDGIYFDDEEKGYSNDGTLAKACFTLCCLLSSIPFVLIMLVIILTSLF